jgi:hypothetical protein
VICDAIERAVLLWILRSGSTGSHGLNMQPVTAVTEIQDFLNAGPLSRTGEEAFSLYGYCGEEEVRKKLPNITIVCTNAQQDISAPGNYVVDVEVIFTCNATSRPSEEDGAETDVITLADAVGRWLDSVLSQSESDIVDQINNGHEWCTVMMMPQRATWQRIADKSTRGHRATFQLYGSLSNYR